MSRKLARESVLKILYSLEFNDDALEQLEWFIENQVEKNISDTEKEYLKEMINGVEENKEFIDSNIEKYLKGWKISRICKIDLVVLRLAVYELLIRDDVPLKVAINEAVELAKTYSSKESSSFINGVLREVAKLKNDLE